MKLLNKTFLFRLYAADKKLFGFIAVYIAGILLCVLNCNTFLFANRCEEFPFLLYGMYSLREESQTTYTTYSFYIDNKEVNYTKLKDSQRELMTSPLIHAAALFDSTNTDTIQANQLKEWLFRYSVDMRGLLTNKMDVYKLTCTYDGKGSPQILKKELLYSYVID